VKCPRGTKKLDLLRTLRIAHLVAAFARRLGRGSLIQDRNQVRLALGATAAAFKMGALFDREGHMVDITINLR
jgi:hypothetical protein